MAEWYSAGGLAIARSRVRIPPTCAVYQRQLSVPSLWGGLMSTSKSWGVNGHTTRCTGPVSVVLRLRLVSGWGLWNGDQRRPMDIKARERTLLLLTYSRKMVLIFYSGPWLSKECLPVHHEIYFYQLYTTDIILRLGCQPVDTATEDILSTCYEPVWQILRLKQLMCE